MWLKIRPYLLLMPAVGLTLLLFFGGLALGLLQSLGLFSISGGSSFTFEWYQTLLVDQAFWKSFWLSFYTAGISTLISAVLGILTALGLLRLSYKWQRMTQFALLVPHFIAGYVVILLFMQSGWVSRWLHAFGLIDSIEQFPILVNDPFGWGVILTYIWKETPFIALMVYPVLARIYQSWLEVAQTLGASRLSFFREIVLPLVLPAWLASALIVLAFTFSAFEVPYLLGVTFPETLSVFSYQTYLSGSLEERPLALAVNFLLAVATGFLGWIAYQWSKRWSVQGWKGW
ncbi:ABC transporter permease [Ammoniphilus resinae]|uniref:Spermidine/putrescine transport system permease protein n=1 Tax=Ammoniphilus resinae TaxID=861532 RepID=A0ABS4GT02_9BACL|nr:ABC transporter permease subunit [Ammoniphilus resinae]MBP1933157.1 putative spermidine/putrescine transport system permease protein [Ammoniphilus resinae]